jgi:hypothetical protein
MADRGSLHVTVDVLDKDIKGATRQASPGYDQLKQAIEKLELANLNLSTSEYSVREERVWENQKQVSKGFRARMGLSVVTSATERLGEVIALASRAGIQDVGALTTFLSEGKRLDEQMECLKQAAENARAKAERLATSLGAKVGDVLAVSEQGGSGSEPLPRFKAEIAAMGAAPEIAVGTQTLQLDVSVSFLIH